MKTIVLLMGIFLLASCASKQTVKTAQNIEIHKSVLAAVCEDCAPLSDIVKNYESMGGDTKALSQALCMVNRYHELSQTGYANDVFFVNDLNKDSREPRFFAVNMKNGIVGVTYSMHGRGTDKKKEARYQATTSSKDRSLLTPSGLHLVSTKLPAQGGGSEHYITDGLQEHNTTSRKRLITLWLPGEGFLGKYRKNNALDGVFSSEQTQGKAELKRLDYQVTSKGSIGINRKNFEELLRATKARSQDPRGALVFNYSGKERNLASNYCQLTL